MDKEQYIEIFIEETREHLQNLTLSLLQLEKDPRDNATINEIFRSAHTLKGMSSTMGFGNMSRMTHKMEDVLDLIRTDKLKVNAHIADVLFKCLDALEGYLENIVNSGSDGNNEHREVIELLSKELSSKEDSSKNNIDEISHLKADTYELSAINKAFEMGMNVYQINVKLDSGCLLKSARVFLIFQALEKHSEIIKANPSVEDLEDEKFDFEFSVLVVTNKGMDVFKKVLNTISEIEKVEVFLYNPLCSSIDENVQYTSCESGDDHDNNKDDQTTKDETAKGKATTSKTVRVDIERLDILMNLVSELIIQKTRLSGITSFNKSRDFVEAIEYLERITTNLHDAVMKVRMVPIEKVFNRFPRMIRDISRDLNKNIVLSMSGEETELDRTVIDEIGDPLIHILRNAADHGIESNEVRRKTNKKEEGHIYLRAYQDGNNVVIEIEDDGQGLDVESIRKKGIERGIIKADYADSLSREEITGLIFAPGFSTAEKISDLSGRGVGLDVVKTKIESMSGTIEIETEKGKGTKFIIRLPLTLAIIQALLIKIGQEKYAIPLNSTSQILKVKPSEIKTIQKREVILIRNVVVPIIRLGTVLDVKKGEDNGKEITIVVVKKGEKLSGFVVDRVLGQQEIVIKSPGKLLQRIKCIAGATILGDGNVALILDVNSLA